MTHYDMLWHLVFVLGQWEIVSGIQNREWYYHILLEVLFSSEGKACIWEKHIWQWEDQFGGKSITEKEMMIRYGYNEDGRVRLKSRYTNDVELAGLGEWRGKEFVAILNVQKKDFFSVNIKENWTYFNSVEKESVVRRDK